MVVDKTTIAIIIALLVFIFSVIFQLFTRNKEERSKKKYQPHPTRIDFALHHFRHNDIKKITNNLWEEVTGVSDATASRDLAQLTDMGVLKKKGKGRGVHYIFVKHQK